MKTLARFITRTTYRKEMFLVISLKLLAIFTLWFLCFSHPIKHSLTTATLQARYTQ